jgi:hypothetical protein
MRNMSMVKNTPPHPSHDSDTERLDANARREIESLIAGTQARGAPVGADLLEYKLTVDGQTISWVDDGGPSAAADPRSARPRPAAAVARDPRSAPRCPKDRIAHGGSRDWRVSVFDGEP